MRSSAYYVKRPKGTKLDVYRNRKFSQTQKRPMLIPVIVNDWMTEQAFLFIRPNDFPNIASPITVRHGPDSTAQFYQLDVPTKPAQYDFATDLYESIVAGEELAIMLSDSTFLPIYESRLERGVFLGVTQDYYRLTERI